VLVFETPGFLRNLGQFAVGLLVPVAPKKSREPTQDTTGLARRRPSSDKSV